MKKVIIFGVSSVYSIGYHIGQHLSIEGFNAVYISRSGKLGKRCDVTVEGEAESMLRHENPQVVVYAAGVFNNPQELGFLKNISKASEHIKVKSIGLLLLGDAVVKTPSVEYIIVLGGRSTSSHPGFAAYSIANGALWSFVTFFAQHVSGKKIYYIDLPLIKDSAMAQKFIRLNDKRVRQADIALVNQAIIDVLHGKHKNGSRIVIDKESTL